jgi:hypothetical protein
LFGEGRAADVGGLLQISCSATSVRQEDLKDGVSPLPLNSSKPCWNSGKSSSFGKPSMVVIFIRNDAFWVILWNIFGFRMMHGAIICGDIFGEQMEDNSIGTGTGTGIILNLERMTRSNRYPLERFILIVTSLRNMS